MSLIVTNVFYQSIIRYLRVIGLCHFLESLINESMMSYSTGSPAKSCLPIMASGMHQKSLLHPMPFEVQTGTSATRKYWLFWCYESKKKHSHRDRMSLRNTFYNSEQTNREKVGSFLKIIWGKNVYFINI